MDWLLDHLIGPVGAAIAVAVAGVVGEWIRRRVTRGRELVSLLDAAHRQVAAVAADVASIKGELAPNGGHTLRDKVNALTATMAGIDARTRRTDALQCVLIETMSQPTFETDEQGRWRTVSRGLEQLTGYDGRELVGNGWRSVIPMDERDHVLREWQHAVKDRRSIRLDFTIVSRAGHSELVRLIAEPMIDDAVDPTGIVGWWGTVEPRP